MILAVVKVIYAIAYMKKPKKNSGLERNLNPRPRDTGATDVGNWTIMSSYVPV